ncbi:MAG: alpha/beta hydrolase, partial [Bacteroidetes bacterium]|nr:alpha/beta hydrolase [Bacteroidota bacterium]
LVETLMVQSNTSKFSLAGYSMGGRVCLVIAEMMPEKIEQIMLVASDGLVFSPLYFFVTKTLLGRKIFRGFLADPNKYLKLLKWLRDKDWIDASRYKFITYYLENAVDREFLRHVWQDMSLIVPSMKDLKSAINKYQIPICIFSGKFDRVIPTSQAKQFMKGLSTVQILVVQHGHRMFGADTLPKMASYLITGKC